MGHMVVSKVSGCVDSTPASVPRRLLRCQSSDDRGVAVLGRPIALLPGSAKN